MKYMVGVNVSSGPNGGFEVHSATCADLKRKSTRSRYNAPAWPVEATSAQAALDALLDEIFDGESTHREVGYRGRVLSCTK